MKDKNRKAKIKKISGAPEDAGEVEIGELEAAKAFKGQVEVDVQHLDSISSNREEILVQQRNSRVNSQGSKRSLFSHKNSRNQS